MPLFIIISHTYLIHPLLNRNIKYHIHQNKTTNNHLKPTFETLWNLQHLFQVDYSLLLSTSISCFHHDLCSAVSAFSVLKYQIDTTLPPGTRRLCSYQRHAVVLLSPRQTQVSTAAPLLTNFISPQLTTSNAYHRSPSAHRR